MATNPHHRDIGKRMVEVTDLPDASMLFAKPYRLDAVTAAARAGREQLATPD